MKIAILVMGVVDTGMTNPIDLLPIFNVASQVILQVKQKADA